MKSFILLLWLIVLGSTRGFAVSGVESEAPPASSPNFVVEGLLVCLDGDLKEIACKDENERYGLKTAKGLIYALQDHENVAALHLEKRLKTRQFRLTLRRNSNSPLWDLVKSQLIRDGKVYDFHYFCEVCNITTRAPGLCMCCREETEYRESPVE